MPCNTNHDNYDPQNESFDIVARVEIRLQVHFTNKFSIHAFWFLWSY